MNLPNLKNTQIFDKISTRDLSGLEKLIDEKVNVNQLADDESTTPLIEAIKIKWLEGIMLLIKGGANVNLCSKNEVLTHFDRCLSPLGIAVHVGDVEIVLLLLKAGANPNNHDSPLYIAIEQGVTSGIKWHIKTRYA